MNNLEENINIFTKMRDRQEEEKVFAPTVWRQTLVDAYEKMIIILTAIKKESISEEDAWRVISNKYNQDEENWQDAKKHYVNSISNTTNNPNHVKDKKVKNEKIN